MEQIIQKPPFPIKTKIAVWWMIIGVVIETVVSFRFLVAEDLIAFLLFPILLILSRYYIQLRPGLFLLNRRRHGWWLAAISLSIILISLFIFASFQSPLNFGEQPGFILVALLILSVFPFLFPSILFFDTYQQMWVFRYFLIFIPLIPLILLLLDRKNFWKIAS